MDVIRFSEIQFVRRDGVSCQETPLLEGIDLIKLRADLVAKE